MKPRRLYIENRQSARQRGIPFKITFEEWLAWWQRQLGPDWQLLRGRRRYQFHMARVGDRGPYKLGNIKCITNSENIKEAWEGERMRVAMASPERAAKISAFFKGRMFSPEHLENLSTAMMGNRNAQGQLQSGEYNNSAKLNNEEVRTIRRIKLWSRSTAAELAQQYGVCASWIRQIRNRKGWQGIE